MPSVEPTLQPSARRWLAVDVALLGLALVLVVVLAVLWTRDDAPAAGDPHAERLSALQREVADAALAEVRAFLEVDHRDMDAVTERVLAGATGDFAEQYAVGRDRLVARVERAEAEVSSSSRALGVGLLEDDRAEVLVAADSVLVDRSTGEEPRFRKHRLRLVLERDDAEWLVAELELAP